MDTASIREGRSIIRWFFLRKKKYEMTTHRQAASEMALVICTGTVDVVVASMLLSVPSVLLSVDASTMTVAKDLRSSVGVAEKEADNA